MDFISRHKMILILLALAVAGFFWYSSSSQAPGSILTKDNAELRGNSADKTLLLKRFSLCGRSLSGDHFFGPVFPTLKRLWYADTLEPAGRTDPFAPLSASAAPQVPASSQGAQPFKADQP